DVDAAGYEGIRQKGDYGRFVRNVTRLVKRRRERGLDRPFVQVSTTVGCKYVLNDDSWLLIRPSGTEPVLRVYAEGRSPEMVRALLDYGEEVAEKAV
ncbi:MAG: hypothetical protein ACK2T7_01790, partial [Anaerolineales bacterium]